MLLGNLWYVICLIVLNFFEFFGNMILFSTQKWFDFATQNINILKRCDICHTMVLDDACYQAYHIIQITNSCIGSNIACNSTYMHTKSVVIYDCVRTHKISFSTNKSTREHHTLLRNPKSGWLRWVITRLVRSDVFICFNTSIYCIPVIITLFYLH